MKKNVLYYLSLTSLLFLSVAVFGQRKCGSYEHLMQQMKDNPRFASKIQMIEQKTEAFLQSPKLKAAGPITIPVHVIVVYSNASQNISDAQIQSQIDVLNLDYSKQNSDWQNTPSEFFDLVANCEYVFVLQGIERHSNSTVNWGLNDAVKAAYPPYSPNTTLNLWVANIGSGYLGYAQFPGGPAATDGVVIAPQYFGSSDYDNGSFYLSAPFDKGRTATHEIGHWLNLRHIWGDGTCATDYVDDTPSAEGPNYGCPAFPHFTCGSDDMFMNYMDYTDDGCMYMFTNGQKDRTKAIFATGGPRESFVSGGTTTCNVTACDGNINLNLKLDNYPSETSWTLVSENGTTIDQGSGYSTRGQTITKSWSLSEGKYTFTIYDAYGDGICCSYGSGSYSLTDGCSNTLKSGGSFGTSEGVTFCVPAGSANQPPVAEANGPYYGVAGTDITFNSTGSGDPDGTVTGYLWDFGDGSTSTLATPTHFYASPGTYVVTLTVTDNSGATATDQATVDVTASGSGTTVQLNFSNFENGFGIWTDGGADCALYTSGTYAYSGSRAIDIQDNSGVSSSFYLTNGIDVKTPGYSTITVDFYFYAVSMETGEDFWVQYYNGSSWQTVAAFASGTSFSNDNFYHAVVTISKSLYNFPTNMRIRFMCDASNNSDDVYIDDVTILASTGIARQSDTKWLEPVNSFKMQPPVEVSDNELTVFPNPAGEVLSVKISIEDQSVAYITDLSGKLLKAVKLESDVTSIDVSSLKPGIYFIKVINGSDSLIKKFIKK